MRLDTLVAVVSSRRLARFQHDRDLDGVAQGVPGGELRRTVITPQTGGAGGRRVRGMAGAPARVPARANHTAHRTAPGMVGLPGWWLLDVWAKPIVAHGAWLDENDRHAYHRAHDAIQGNR